MKLFYFISKWIKFWLFSPPFGLTGIKVSWDEESRHWDWVKWSEEEKAYVTVLSKDDRE